MNEHKRNIRITALLATLLAIMGFYQDGNLENAGLFTIVFEILLMTSILFVLFASVYFLINYIFTYNNSTEDVGN